MAAPAEDDRRCSAASPTGRSAQLRLIRSSFSFPIDMTDWRLDPARGGGALWDVGCYGVSTARLFAGAEPESVEAVAPLRAVGRRPLARRRAEVPGRRPRRDRLQLRAAVPLLVRAGRHRGPDRGPRRLPAARAADRRYYGPSGSRRASPRSGRSPGRTSMRRWSTPSPRPSPRAEGKVRRARTGWPR